MPSLIEVLEEDSKKSYLEHIDTCPDCILVKVSRDPKDACKKAVAIATAFVMMKQSLLGTERLDA